MEQRDAEQLKIQALDFAIRHNGGRADTAAVVKTAQSFYKFLTSSTPATEKSQ